MSSGVVFLWFCLFGGLSGVMVESDAESAGRVGGKVLMLLLGWGKVLRV